MMNAGEGAVLPPIRSWLDTVRESMPVALMSYLGPLFAIWSCVTFPLSFESVGVLHGSIFYITEIILGIDLLCHVFHIYPDLDQIVSNNRWCTIIIPRCSTVRMYLEVAACIQLQWIFKGYTVGKYLIVIKVVRVLKVSDLFKKLERDLPMKYMYINSLKLIILQCYLAHIASCAFYHVAVTFPPPSHDTWLKHLQLGDIGAEQKYMASFYFAIVTMYTVGYGDIHPVNAMEMMFTIGVIMLGLIASIYLIGQVSDLFAGGVITSELMIKMLKSYMEDNGLEDDRLISQTMLAIRRGEDLTNKGVGGDYPMNIRVMLYRPILQMVGLFQTCSPRLLDLMASEVYEEFFLPGEVIIEEGNIVDQLYIFCGGCLERIESRFGEVIGERIRDCRCIGAESFFCNVPYYSTIQVVEPSRILKLNKRALMIILGTNIWQLKVIQQHLKKEEDKNFGSDFDLLIAEHKAEQATKLNLATYARNEEKLKELVDTGINVNTTDDYERSPWHLAATNGDVKIISFLIERRAEVNIKDCHGNTPLICALYNYHFTVVDLLFNNGAVFESDAATKFLFGAVWRNECDTIMRMVGKMNPNVSNYNYQTLLHIAAAKGYSRLVDILLKAGACITLRDSWGQLPIYGARRFGHENVIRKLQNADAKLRRLTS